MLAELKGVAHGRLVVAANTTGGMYIVPPLLAAYKERHPDLELKRPFVMFYRQGKYFGPMAKEFMKYMREHADS